jgi:hypothetical protein
MATIAGSGVSTRAATIAATNEALNEAEKHLDGRRPAFGFLFISPKHSLEAALATARAALPSTDFLGCTTAGELSERGLVHGGISTMLVASDESLHQLAVSQRVTGRTEAAVADLCNGFPDLLSAAKARRFVDSTTVALVDGLNGVGESLINGMVKATRGYHQIVGGAAGDEGAFKATACGGNDRHGSDAAGVLHVFSAHPWGVGVDHGLRPSTEKMRVTKAAGNVVYELDGKPAFEVYRAYAKRQGVDLRPDNASSFLINNEIGVYFLQQLQRARAPLSVGNDGSLTCAAAIEQGASVSILDGKSDDLVAAATRAATEARNQLRGTRPAGVLLFDCICRGAILGNQFQAEIDAVRAIFPDTPISGFLTYGEIARYKGRLDGWPNTTLVVAAIPSS